MKEIIIWADVAALTIFIFFYNGGLGGCDLVTSCSLLLIFIGSVCGLIMALKRCPCGRKDRK